MHNERCTPGSGAGVVESPAGNRGMAPRPHAHPLAPPELAEGRRAALTGRKSIPRTPPAADKITKSPTPGSPTTPVPAPPVPSSTTLGDPPPQPDRPVRLPWADLIRRVHRIDVSRCSHCGGRLRVIAQTRPPRRHPEHGGRRRRARGVRPCGLRHQQARWC